MTFLIRPDRSLSSSSFHEEFRLCHLSKWTTMAAHHWPMIGRKLTHAVIATGLELTVVLFVVASALNW